MTILNFSHRFASLVQSGAKTQTIRPDSPRYRNWKVGQNVDCWEGKRGLKKSCYCQTCLNAFNEYEETPCVLEEHRNRDGIILPRKLGSWPLKEKFSIELGFSTSSQTNEKLPYLKMAKKYFDAGLDQDVLAKADGFSSSKDFFAWFDEHYDISKKPQTFWVLHW